MCQLFGDSGQAVVLKVINRDVYGEIQKEGEKVFQDMYTTKKSKHCSDKQYNFKGDPPGKYDFTNLIIIKTDGE